MLLRIGFKCHSPGAIGQKGRFLVSEGAGHGAVGWTGCRPGRIIAKGMRRILILALAGALLVSAAAPASARYDCRVTGARNQPACCCKGPSSTAPSAGDRNACPSKIGSTDSCGCCDVTYDGDRPAAVAADRTGGPVQTVSASVDHLPPSISVAMPSHHLGIHAARIWPPGEDLPTPRAIDRHVLLCTFLC